MGIKSFHEIFALEVRAINERRRLQSRGSVTLEEEERQQNGTPVLRPTPESKLIGLALSGGGIRSAAFCLGAMQALNLHGLMSKFDYLSSVSGGGYIGISMTAAMSESATDKFPFATKLSEGEEAGVQHIRDHANYLFPQGVLNIFSNVAIYLRGLLANVVLVMPWLLLEAAVTIALYPDQAALPPIGVRGVTAYDFKFLLGALSIVGVLLASWALWRSMPLGRNASDIGLGARFFGVLLVIVLATAIVEVQPLLIAGFFLIGHSIDSAGGFFAATAKWLSTVAGVLAGFGALVGFLSSFLANALKRAKQRFGSTAIVAQLAIKLAMYAAGIAVPLALWLIYFYLTYWGIEAHDPDHPQNWLKSLSQATPYRGGSVLALYVEVAVLLLAVGACLGANANSLHQLYRDRLSKAFLFNPNRRMTKSIWRRLAETGSVEADTAWHGCDLLPLDGKRISSLTTAHAPYHLINTALNIRASKYANRRGRDADFFIFSPLFTGSEATGYVETPLMEKKLRRLTVATAMAVSGAAASANMGSDTIKSLVPALSILNVRLGYWLVNPRKVAGLLEKSWIAHLFDRLYFLKELFGLLSEESDTVYITDGGHIENLGLYELLRRRCKMIVVIDGDADPEMSFGDLVTLERYARIDFGIRIDLPWTALRDASRRASEEIAASGGLSPSQAAHGPHCALGTIHYPRKVGETDEDDSTGVLLYVKSSFTGDENDYIVDYKRRHPDFPHETTLDQFFSEEQFEVYRALGFHAVNSAFNRADKVAMKPELVPWQGDKTAIPLERRMLDIFG
ncbi:patatin-like phospholipase family protein [Bradyrhizobium lablabi]|uniref:patatin-like phospholipase family protein n=1 Tax=Bradyrhizobium lablabi TaxID=722472 RepID=UPI001BA743E8|nr:patatin-like phospholipase family protein [Bradyrhizobium lablabi]MBR0697989.1 patatin-like phospholipase family protein [Bradyrhizobium lablabi]